MHVKAHARHTSGIAEQAGNILFSQWNEFRRLRKAVLAHRDTDSIHDLRVATRRLRATVGLFAPFISVKTVKALSKKIRRVTSLLGRVRNIDEARIYFNALSADLPVLSKRLRRARKSEIAAVLKALKQFPCQAMAKVLRKTAAQVAGRRSDEEIEAYLSDTSIQRYQALHDLLAPATIPENREERHALRIAIKKWRYLLETLGQVSGQDYAVTLETLKEYQTLLGNLNDMVEFGVLSETLTLPPQEKAEIKDALAQDTARHFECFVRIAAARPLQYIFLL